MIKLKLIIVQSLLFSLFILKTVAQLPQNVNGKVNVVAPNAASLGKYGDIPVNYHTGVPGISIPLYTLKEGSLTLPITLNYHASGLKVEETDSWVGAGWSLSAGGVITRIVKDKPDEKQAGGLTQTYGHFSDYGLANYWNQMTGVDESSTDGEPGFVFL